MNQCRGGEWSPGDATGVDLPEDELERLARVDALLRLTAARDLDDPIARSRRQAAAPTRAQPQNLRRCAEW